MSLRYIYGRSGTGKSTFCFKYIKAKYEEQINEYKKEKIYMITPEQFSFTAEQELLETLGVSSCMFAEVISFKRIAKRIFDEVGYFKKDFLSKNGRKILIYSILLEEKEKLNFLGQTSENVDLVLKTITELKKHGITIDKLKKAKKEINDEYLNLKLQDIGIIYEKFENRIKENYIDEDDILTLVLEKIEKSTMFDNSIIYIDEFSGFTKQEYLIIEQILKKAKQVNLTICTDTLEDSNMDNIFGSASIVSKRLEEIARKNKIKIEGHIFLDKPYRFKNEELIFLEQNLYKTTYKKYEKEVSNVKLFLAANPYTEVENIAKNIIDKVRLENIRFKDILVIVKDIQMYSNIIKAVFANYKIPIFIDEKKDLSENILVKFIFSILDIFSKGWTNETVFSCIKTNFFDLRDEEIFDLENYSLKWGIKGKKWYEGDWSFGLDEKNKEEIEKINISRRKVVERVISFKENLNRAKTAEDISKQIYLFLINQNILEKLNKKIEKLLEQKEIETAKEYESSIKIVLDVLDEIVLLFKNDKMSFEKYRDIFKMSLSGEILGKIPATLDQVMLADVSRSRTSKVKATYILGVNDGLFPSNNIQEGYINDKDRDLLRQNGFEIAKGTEEILLEEQLYIYKAFTSCSDFLYISYLSSDQEGKSLRKASVISKLKKMFIKLKEESDITKRDLKVSSKEVAFESLLIALRIKQEGEEIDSIWEYIYNMYLKDEVWSHKLKLVQKALNDTNQAEEINKENIKRLYGSTLKTSVSRLEQYKKCPFSFHLKYGLKLKEKEQFGIKAVDTGSFMHNVIDKFFEYTQENNILVKEIEDEEIKKIVEKIINELLELNSYYLFKSNPRFFSLTNRLKKVVTKCIIYIIYQLKCSSFSVVGTEIEFKENSVYEPIRIDLEDGLSVEILGKIDRVDIAKDEKGKYLRIIDYKSSVKNIDLNEVVEGLQIQLLTYMDAASKLEEAIPAGVLYFGLIDNLVKAKKNLSEEEIESQIKKQFKMNGLILADINVVKMMDKNLSKGYSSFVPAYIDKDGALSKQKSNVITKEDFEKLQNYVKVIIKQISKEILAGKIDIKPYYDVKSKKSSCIYCEYRPICRFNKTKKGNDYFYINRLKDEEILEKVRKNKC